MPLQQITYRRRRYYADVRLRQFRSIPRGFGVIEFVEFDSDKGRAIHASLVRRGVVLIWPARYDETVWGPPHPWCIREEAMQDALGERGTLEERSAPE